VKKTGKIIARVLPFLCGVFFLISLLAVRFKWISVELSPSPVNAEAVFSAATSEVSLASSPRGRYDRRNFTLGEKIYARVQLQGVSPGKHLVSFRWINPRGKLEESYKKSFSPHRGRYNCWSWLELKGADWFPVSLGSFGTTRFRGLWRVRIFLDEKFLDESEFVVN